MIKDRILEEFVRVLVKHDLPNKNIEIISTNIKGRGHFSTNYALINGLSEENKKVLEEKVVLELNSESGKTENPFLENKSSDDYAKK